MRRKAARIRALLRIVVSIAVFAGAFAVLFFVGALLSVVADPNLINRPISTIITAGMLFSVIGALFGTIIVLDSSAGFPVRIGSVVRTFNLRGLRTAMGAVWGAFAVYLANYLTGGTLSALALVIGSLVGAVLGWLGWRWARYIDF